MFILNYLSYQVFCLRSFPHLQVLHHLVFESPMKMKTTLDFCFVYQLLTVAQCLAFYLLSTLKNLRYKSRYYEGHGRRI